MDALSGVTDPEAKRKIIGRLFVEVFQEEAEKLQNAKWLAQGTIYPDVIESNGAKTKKAQTANSTSCRAVNSARCCTSAKTRARSSPVQSC